MKQVLYEGLCVAVGGILAAFLANAFSPRGLALNHNYFPDVGVAKTNLTTEPGRTNSPAEVLAASLKALGLQLVDSNAVSRLFQDPRREQNLLLFIDAREEAPYQAGHVPGAFEYNHFHPERYLANVVPACEIAQQIVVYCNGGDCEESKFAALSLRESLSGVSRTNLLIYGGGMTEWVTNHWPVELGERNSGRFLDPNAPTALPPH